jgi:alkylated DNA repair dioxygenase AlkB
VELGFPIEQTLLSDEIRRCQVTYHPAFLSLQEADALFDFLQRRAPFIKESPVVFGKAHPIERASCAFGDEDTSYHYAGVTRPATTWPPLVRAVKEKIEASQKATFNFVLCNLYPDGQSGLGWHADDERDLSPGAPIASISLGAERDFYVRHRDTREVVVKKNLSHGSLLLMKGQTQTFYQHQIPKRAKCSQPRINLTFRLTLSIPGR